MLNRLGFYLKARTRHGTHSPFIYDFLDQTLYANRHSEDPSEQLLLSAIQHFKPQTLGFMDTPREAREKVLKTGSGLTVNSQPYDMGIAAAPGPGLVSWIEDQGLWHSNSIVFIGDIRKSSEARAIWKCACRAKGIRLRLETYEAGLLFFRPEQAPEHFKIRL